MGGTDWKRVGLGVATGGMSEVPRQYSAMRGGNDYGTGKGGGKNGGPQPPDFAGAANEQSRLSHNDVNGTFGGAQWSQGPDGRWTLNTQMAPELRSAAGNLMGQIQNTPDAGAARDQAIDSAYRMQTSRLDPRFSQARSALETQLTNQGFSRGDEGWNRGMDEFNRGQNDAYQQALLGAQSGAGNTAYAQTLAAAMQPYQQLGAIQNMGEGMGRQALAGAQSPDLLSALTSAYGGQLQNYGIQQQNKNSMMSGAASLGPLIAASDESLKQDIVRSDLEVIPGVPYAEWRWKRDGTKGHGVIAQDLEKVRPDLVVMHPAGYRLVNYCGLALAAMEVSR